MVGPPKKLLTLWASITVYLYYNLSDRIMLGHKKPPPLRAIIMYIQENTYIILSPSKSISQNQSEPNPMTVEKNLKPVSNSSPPPALLPPHAIDASALLPRPQKSRTKGQRRLAPEGSAHPPPPPTRPPIVRSTSTAVDHRQCHSATRARRRVQGRCRASPRSRSTPELKMNFYTKFKTR